MSENDDVNAPADPQSEPGDTFIELRNGVPYIGTYGVDDDDSGDNTPPWLPS